MDTTNVKRPNKEKSVDLDEFIMCLKEVVHLLVLCDYEVLITRGNAPRWTSQLLHKVLIEEGPYAIWDHLDEDLPPEAYRFILPPEEAIIDAVRNAASGSDLYKFLNKEELSGDDCPRLKDFFDNDIPVPYGTEWCIEIDMWAVAGQTQLTLILDAKVFYDQLKMEIREIEVM